MNHPEQIRMHNSPARFQVAAAGRRSFKSERKKRKLIIGDKYHPGALTLEDGNFFYAAPTHLQAKRIAWNDLKNMTRPFWNGKPSESELCISLITGSRLFVLGMDEPARIEGMQWHAGVLDEYANMRAELWQENVRPVFSDTGGWCDLIGVPEGRNHYYERAEYARHDITGEWDFFWWKSADILDPIEIEKLQNELDPRTFRQEYEASFETLGNIVYDCFSSENGGSLCEVEFQSSAHTWLCWDFNSTNESPLACIVVQFINGNYYVVEEFVFTNTKTDEMCEAVKKFLTEKNFSAPLSAVGDHAGHQRRSSASYSDWEIIKYHFKNYQQFKVYTRPTLSIRDRTASLNALLKTYSGRRRLFVNRKCRKLIQDFERVEWKENGQGLDDRNKALTHPSDALSYYAYYFHDITSRRTEK